MERSKGAASRVHPTLHGVVFAISWQGPAEARKARSRERCTASGGTRLTPPSSRRRRNSAVGRMEGMKRIRWKKIATAAADHRAHGLIGTEILGAIDIEQRGEFRARPVDAALDGADRTAADRGCVFI